MTKRSPLFYVGDKRKLIDEIKLHFPNKIQKFVEPFVGGGSVFMNVKAQEYILNDINSIVIEIHKFLCKSALKEKSFFRKLFNRIDELNLSCSLKEDKISNELKQNFPKTYFAEFNRNAYNKLKNDYNQSNEKSILDFYILLIYGFNRIIRFNSKGEFNVPVGNVDLNKNVEDALKDYFQRVRQSNIKWNNSDFNAFFRSIDLCEDDFVYCDPPYLITFSEYNKIWNENNELALLAQLDNLHKRNIRFGISNVTHYKGRCNNLFLEWSEKYHSHSIKSNYISYHDNSTKTFNEVLITNF